MKFKELQKKNKQDLQKELDKFNMEVMKYRAQVATGGAGKEPGKIKEYKKSIARIKTLQNKQGGAE